MMPRPRGKGLGSNFQARFYGIDAHFNRLLGHSLLHELCNKQGVIRVELSFNRHGVCVVTKAQTVISLGWLVWGVDFADGRYAIVHVWRPRLFLNMKAR
jgi:hypothetical protein